MASAVSNSVVPATIPDAPTIGTAVAGTAQATVPFTAPSSDGGSAITSYTATSSPGDITGTISQSGSGSITVSGLTNGTAYTFTVTATNAIGTSLASAVSNSVAPATIPDAPTIGTAVPAYHKPQFHLQPHQVMEVQRLLPTQLPQAQEILQEQLVSQEVAA